MNSRIAITGASGYLGSLTLKALLARPEVESILALDLRTPSVSDERVVYQKHDVRENCRGLIAAHASDTLIHLAYPLEHQRRYADVEPYAVAATHHVLDAARSGGVRKVLLCSSTTVYGGHAKERLWRESDEPRPNRGYHYAVGKLAMERIAQRWSARPSECEVVIFRPCIVMGPTMENYMVQGFFGSAIQIEGCDPGFQFLHEDDFAGAMLALLQPGVSGTFNVAPSDPGVPRSEILRLFGVDADAVATSYSALWLQMQFKWIFQRHRAGVVSPQVLPLLAHSWAASNERLCGETQFRARYDSTSTLLEFFKAYRRRQKQNEVKWKTIPA